MSVDDAKVVELSNWAVETIGNGYNLREIKKAEYQVNFNYIYVQVKLCIFSFQLHRLIEMVILSIHT